MSFCELSLLPVSAFVSSFGPTLVHMRHVTATARSQFSRQPMNFLSLDVFCDSARVFNDRDGMDMDE